jgi:hypothetical protein
VNANSKHAACSLQLVDSAATFVPAAIVNIQVLKKLFETCYFNINLLPGGLKWNPYILQAHIFPNPLLYVWL